MVLSVSPAWLLNYVLALLRVAGFLTFVPLPGIRRAPALPKAVLAFLLSLLLAPYGSGLADVSFLSSPAGVWLLAELILSEAALGIAVGAAVGLLLEVFGLAAQILGFQAGYSYINMVDPTTQVDASILNVLLAMLGGLLFFGFDLHLHTFQAFVLSLEQWPLGSFATRPAEGMMMVRLGSAVFETAVRLALPVVAVLLLIDLTLGLLNQINNRLQLLTLAFPAKIIAAIALLYPVLVLAPRVFHGLAEVSQELVLSLVTN